jgi:hypothetical protein
VQSVAAPSSAPGCSQIVCLRTTSCKLVASSIRRGASACARRLRREQDHSTGSPLMLEIAHVIQLVAAGDRAAGRGEHLPGQPLTGRLG